MIKDKTIKSEIVLLLMIVSTTFAQDIEVKKFEPSEKDQTATLSPKKNIYGNAWG